MDELLRELAPRVLGALARRYGQFDAAEDAVQEALLAAATQWPVEGMPGNPRSWLLAVAGRRLVDEFRSESARRRREERDATEPRPPIAAVAWQIAQSRSTWQLTQALIFRSASQA